MGGDLLAADVARIAFELVEQGGLKILPSFVLGHCTPTSAKHMPFQPAIQEFSHDPEEKADAGGLT
jgi:hypothetical protein